MPNILFLFHPDTQKKKWRSYVPLSVKVNWWACDFDLWSWKVLFHKIFFSYV